MHEVLAIINGTDLAAAIRRGEDIDLLWCHVNGEVELRMAKCVARISIRETDFRDDVNAFGAQFQTAVDFSGSCFKGNLNLEGAKVEGGLYLVCSEIRCGAVETHSDFEILEDRLAVGKPLEGWCQWRNLKVNGDIIAFGLAVNSNLNLSHCFVGGDFFMPGCKIRGQLEFGSADINGSLIISCNEKIAGRAVIGGVLRLNHSEIKDEFNFKGALLKGGLFAFHARFGEFDGGVGYDGEKWYPTEIGQKDTDALILTSAYIKGGLLLTGAKVAGRLLAENVEIGGAFIFQTGKCDKRIFRPRLGKNEEGESIRMLGAKVGSNIQLNGARVDGDVLWGQVEVQGSIVCGVWFDEENAIRTEFLGGVYLEGAKIARNVSFQGAKFNRVLVGFSMQVGGYLDLGWWLESINAKGKPGRYIHTVARNGIGLQNAKIGGKLDLRFCESEYGWFRFNGSRIGGGVDGDYLTAPESIHFANAHIDGNCTFAGATIKTNLDFRDLHLVGNLTTNQERRKDANAFWCNIHGKLLLTRAKISGSVNLARFRILNKPRSVVGEAMFGDREHSAIDVSHPRAIDFRHVSIFGDLLFNEGDAPAFDSEVIGDVDLHLADVRGDVRLNHTTIKGGLKAEGATIRGGFNLPDSTVEGDLDLRSAKVFGQAFRDDVDLRHGGGESEQRPQVGGEIKLNAAQLGQVALYFTDHGSHPKAINFERAYVSKLELCGPLPRKHLTRGRTKRKEIFICDGLKFGELDFSRVGYSAPGHHHSVAVGDQYVEFLAHTRFAKSAYIAVEEWLRNHGQKRKADLIFVAMKKREQRFRWHAIFRGDIKEGPAILGHGLLLKTMGHGTRIAPLVGFWIGLFIISWLLFLKPDSVEHDLMFNSSIVSANNTRTSENRTDRQIDADMDLVWSTNGGKPSQWDGFDAFWMALRYQLPLVSSFARHDWIPSTRTVMGSYSFSPIAKELGQQLPPWIRDARYDSVANLIYVANCLILPLVLAGLGGFIKREGR